MNSKSVTHVHDVGYHRPIDLPSVLEEGHPYRTHHHIIICIRMIHSHWVFNLSRPQCGKLLSAYSR